MDLHTKFRIFRLQFIESCLTNRFKNFTKTTIFEQLNNALADAFGNDKIISERTFNEDWKYIKNSLADNELQLEKWKIGHEWFYRYSDTNFSINDNKLSDKEVQRLTDAIKLLQQIKGIDYNEELIEILQKLDAQVKYHSQKKLNAIGFQQQEIAKGYEYIDDIYDAILEKTVIKIVYQPFGREETINIISPYHLRQYNNRWFLFGWEENTKRVANLSLDRIVKAPQVYTNCSYKEAEGVFDVDNYFQHLIGVTKFTHAPLPENIILHVSNKRAPYIITKPLHHTQAYQIKADGNYEIRLQVCINNELTQLLLSFGSDVEVIAPEALRNFMFEEAQKTLNCYLQL